MSYFLKPLLFGVMQRLTILKINVFRKDSYKVSVFPFPQIFQLYFCLLLVLTMIYFVSLSVILLQEALHFCLGFEKNMFFFQAKRSGR